MLKLTSIPDVPGSSQFSRAVLFALLAANMVNFMASAQSYTDAMLGPTDATARPTTVSIRYLP